MVYRMSESRSCISQIAGCAGCTISNVAWVCTHCIHRKAPEQFPLPTFRLSCRFLWYFSVSWINKRQKGVSDLLSAARGSPERVLPSLPDIMRAIRIAILCKNPGVILFACNALRQLATGNKEVRPVSHDEAHESRSD